MKTVIGIDFGTQSARAILADTADGRVLASHTVEYKHGVPEDSLVEIEDYDSALYELLAAITAEGYTKTIAAICVDATSLTMIPLDKNGVALGKRAEFATRANAKVKLWKRHTAQKQANEALDLAKSMNEPFLGRTGGSISSEWMLPKLLETRDEDAEVYGEMDMAVDLCDYLTYLLCGKVVRGIGAMCFKCMWAEDLGFPSDAFLNGLREGFAEEYKHLLRGEVKYNGDVAGYIKKELCEKFGFSEDVAVAAGNVDGFTSLVTLGAMKNGDAAMVVGTSNVLTVQTDELCDIYGICGIARHGTVKGICSAESGQNCTGEMLGWFVENMLPASAKEEAERKGISPHNLMLEKISEPWKNRVVAVDMWNGSRNVPCDLELRGMFAGMSLETKPQDIYLALLQAIVCGARVQIEEFAKYGVTVKRIVATGGIALKNPMLMKQYSDILGMPIEVGVIKEGPAMGTAMFAAVAAGIYADAEEAYKHMGTVDFVTYHPDVAHKADYEEIYRRNLLLRESAKLFK